MFEKTDPRFQKLFVVTMICLSSNPGYKGWGKVVVVGVKE